MSFDFATLFLLYVTEFRHLIGANSVTALYGLLDYMSYIGCLSVMRLVLRAQSSLSLASCGLLA